MCILVRFVVVYSVLITLAGGQGARAAAAVATDTTSAVCSSTAMRRSIQLHMQRRNAQRHCCSSTGNTSSLSFPTRGGALSWDPSRTAELKLASQWIDENVLSTVSALLQGGAATTANKGVVSSSIAEMKSKKNVLQLSVVAVVLAETILFAGSHLETLTSNARPALQAWWRKGRAKYGLFRRSTWQKAPKLRQAWEAQFEPRQQYVLGFLSGVIAVGPILTPAAIAALVTAAAAEANHWIGAGIADTLQQFDVTTWDWVDRKLTAVRACLVSALQDPKGLVESARDKIDLIPSCVRRGLLIGVVVGLFARE